MPRSKKHGDVNSPRRPTTSFNFFMKHKSTEYIEKYTGQMPLGDIIKIMSKDWREMTPNEKKPYEDAAITARQEYETKLEAYKKTDLYREYMEKVARGEADPHGRKKNVSVKKDAQAARAKAAASDDATTAAEPVSSVRQTVSTKPKSKPQVRRMRARVAHRLNCEIFTPEFISFNETRENELRRIIKQARLDDEATAEIENQIDELNEKYNDMEYNLMCQRIKAEQYRKVGDRRLRSLRPAITPKLRDDLNLKADFSLDDLRAALIAAHKATGRDAAEKRERLRRAFAGVKII